ncbi:histidinol dehydrogenase [Flavobacterium humi]|uniref:Histidinol dehydrogenase n=1 Tax=Flavobacterium humi TaxID=2562683 RepID=A0A4Z0LCS9_9FLAO|nr:histidinol dehydrogenase [Flavobacterium humi]TGD59699.1 histidinol dehydrogenase [Flavobacterium humi]
MKKIIYPAENEWQEILKRPASFSDMEGIVKEIFKEVKLKGDTAIAKYTSFFDGVSLPDITVSPEEINEAVGLVPEDLKKAIAQAKKNIETFHSAQKTEKIVVETTEGVTCWLEKKPIQKIGLYIPGGTAPLFSTILMLAVPATLAGCKEIMLCTPPDMSGKIDPAILYAANLCGISRMLKVGGIQAIAGMTFGTASIPKVYKIFGPGNQFVMAAKQMATQFGIAIDMPAGPSELLVFADSSANPKFVAADLLSQAEHGQDSQVVLITTSARILEEVKKEIILQLAALPRKKIAEKALENSKLILIGSTQEAIAMINEYAPEHLNICSTEEEYLIDAIINAGSVFIGNYTPESAGDYASGTNHTLPTNGYARNYSGVHLDSFLKSMTFQKITEKGIRNIGKTIEIMAEAEGLQAHKNAVSIRLKSLADEN